MLFNQRSGVSRILNQHVQANYSRYEISAVAPPSQIVFMDGVGIVQQGGGR
jgi:hypothetical protein